MIIFLLCEPLAVAEGFMLEMVILELCEEERKMKNECKKTTKK
jgi:hypothetical protein